MPGDLYYEIDTESCDELYHGDVDDLTSASHGNESSNVQMKTL